MRELENKEGSGKAGKKVKAAAVVWQAPNSENQRSISENYEALILLAGKPLVGWVVDALAESPCGGNHQVGPKRNWQQLW